MTTVMKTPTNADECRVNARRHVAEMDTLLSQARSLKQKLDVLHEEFAINLNAAVSLYPDQKIRNVQDLVGFDGIERPADLADSIVLDLERCLEMTSKYLLPAEHKLDGDGLLDIIVNLEDGGRDILRIDANGTACVQTDRVGVFSAVGVLDPTTLRRFLQLQPLMRNSYISDGFYFVNAPEDAVLTLTTAQDLIHELPTGYVFLEQDVLYGQYIVIAAVHQSDIVKEDDDEDAGIEPEVVLRNGYFPLGTIHIDDADLISGIRTIGYRNGTHELTLFNWR